MAVEDRVDLVDAARGLVDALRIKRDDALGLGEPVEEQLDRAFRKPANSRGFRGGLILDLREGCFRTSGAGIHERAIDCAGPRKVRQQSVEENGVAARTKRQMQIGALAG